MVLNFKSILCVSALLVMITSCSSEDDIDSSNNKDDSEKTIVAKPFTGKVNWIKTFGGSLNDDVKSIITTVDGGYALLGSAESIDGDLNTNKTASYDYWLLKLDKEGNLLWNKTYGGSSDDQGQKLIQTKDGGFLLSGFSKSNDNDVKNNNGFYDHWIVKTDASGNLEWEKSYGYAGDDRAFSVIQTTDGGFLTSGSLSVEEYKGPNPINQGAKNLSNRVLLHGVGEFWVHKLNDKGIVEWEKFFGGTSNDRATDVISTNDGYIIIGSTESNDFDIKNKTGSSYDFWVVKIDTEGKLLWQKTFGGSEIETANAITKTNDGNFLIVGDTRSNDGNISNALGNADVWAIKIDTEGSLLWEKTFGGSEFDSANDIFISNDGNYIITGSTRSNDKYVSKSFAQNDIWVLKINEKAEVIWNTSFGGEKTDLGFGITENADNEIVVVGSSSSTSNSIVNKGRNDAFIVNIK